MTAAPLEPLPVIRNGRAIDRDSIPLLSLDAFGDALLEAVELGHRVVAMFASEELAAGDGKLAVYAVLADDRQALMRVAYTLAEHRAWHALTPRCAQVHLFEREIAEQYSVKLMDHPWNKPVRFAPPLSRAAAGHAQDRPQIGVTDYYRVEGEEIHEVAVGPVHAGIIEPGHFRFQCYGEQVFHLEISLGYQHRGVERALLRGPDKRSLHYAETLAGDTTIGHAAAYCQVIEALADSPKTARAQTLRGVALELERLANHVGDLGALALDVGFLPTSSFCGRIRGDFLNMTAALCGNRFGRGLLRPGGVGFDVSAVTVDDLLHRLDIAERECASAINLLWDSPSVMARFEEIGIVPAAVAQELGLVGVAARACGLPRDARQDHPGGIFRFVQIPVANADSGDVFARAYVRWLEVQRSLMFLKDQLHALPAGETCSPVAKIRPRQLAIALVEAWRGELCHVALTDEAGRFERYKIVDPSFHNWSALAYALRNGQISDFPICNKSFSLSYCGFDL
jgi:Ni,Fe-hydrogenase III large subunit